MNTIFCPHSNPGTNIIIKSPASNPIILFSNRRRHISSFHSPSQRLIHLTSDFPLPPKTRISISKPPSTLIHYPHTSTSKSNSFYPRVTAHHDNGGECVQSLPPSTTSTTTFWSAVTLIVGTAVGPGMLALPSKTLKSGPLPSTIAILLSWVYVISSIILIAELTTITMREDNVEEVSFTGLAIKSLGTRFGAFVSIIYASLSFSLMVACVSGIGSVVSQSFPSLHLVTANALFPVIIGTLICFFPFCAVDVTNRLLCVMMIVFITALVGVGLSVTRVNVLCGNAADWRLCSVLPAVPVTVLTLGFHVVTPFVCRIVSGSVSDACKAVLVGGSVPLLMVLSWNLIVLGLVGVDSSLGLRSGVYDPISLLLSVKSSASFAVQGFAFSALATSLIGYVVSFPKQLMDTLELIFGCKEKSGAQNESGFVLPVVLVVPVLVASFYPSTFSRALDFAGVYANCFLFGILPPLMTYSNKAKKKIRTSILPGGDISLFLLFSVAVVLGIWH